MKKRFVLKTRSISTELTVSLFLLVLLVEGVLLWIVYSRQSQFLHHELERKADIYAFNLSEVLGVPLWNLDDEQVENIGSGYTQNEIVNGLYIRNSEGKTLFEFHKPEAAKNHIKRYTKITYKNQIVGNAELFISIDKYNVDLAWLRNLIVLILTGSLIVIFIATGFLLRVYIHRPMSVLQNGIDRVAKGDYSYKFDDIYHIELSGIAKRFKEMAIEIQNREMSLKNEVIERKRTEVSLRESELRYRSLNENIPVGVFRSKPDGEIISFNPALFQMLDIPDEWAINQLKAEDFYLESKDRQTMLDEIYRNKQIQGFQCQLKKNGGDTVWVSISARGIEDESGRINYIDGIVEDIHGRKMAEEALHLSLGKYKKTFWAAPIWVVLSTFEDGRYMEVNESFLKAMGYKMEEVIGKTSLELKTWVDPRDRERIVGHVKNHGGIRNAEVQRRTRSGAIIDTLFSAETLRLADKPVMISVTQDITERKQAEVALRRAEEQNRLLLEQVHGIVWTVDKSLRFTSSRGAGLANIGLKPDQIVGQRLQKFLGSDDAQAITAVQQAFAGQSVKYEEEWGGIPWESRVEPLRNPDGQIVGSIAMSLDITERKRAEETLHKYEHIVSATSDLMSFFDRNYIYRAVNQAYLEYHNKRYEEVIGHSVADLHGDKLFDEVIKKEVDKCLSGQKITYQVWIGYPGRGRRFMDVIYNPYTDELGSISGVVVTARDITEQRRIQEALQESEERFRLTFDKSPIGAAMVSPDLRIQHVNDELCRIMGFSKQELLSSSISRIVHPDDVAADMEEGRKILSGEKDRFDHEERCIRKDGQVIWARLSVGVVKDSAGQPLYFLSLIQDITERKRAEEQLAQHREHLEELVEERTLQLEKEIDERKDAERQIAASLAEKEVLLREIHHRVKNNLNTVSNLLYLQSRTLEDSRVEGAFRESRNRIQTMARVHELLHHSESLARIDMNVYLKELTADLAETFPHRHALLESCASDVTLEIDRAIPCGLIVTELVSNSLKYAFTTDTSEDRISVELSTQGDDCRLVVADNGCGLPDGLNIEQTRSLGLRLVEMLTRQLNGNSEIKSAPGQGTRYCVLFKVTELEEE